MENDSFDNVTNPCDLIKPPFGRFVLVGLVGTVVSIISAMENGLLFGVWVTKRSRRYSHFLYLICLAFADTFVSVSYILLMSVSVLMDWYELETLYGYWRFYMPPILTISHVTMTSSGFFIAAATYERFLIVTRSNILGKIRNNRKNICILILLFALISKGPIFFEVETQQSYFNCTGMTEFTVNYSSLAQHPIYNTIFRFWYRNMATIFLPFVVCLYTNVGIVATLRHKRNSAKLFRHRESLHKRNFQSATRMLILVVTTYLLAKTLNVFITAWEFIDVASLYELHQFYMYCSDVISFLTVCSCSIRLPIYWACSEEVRVEIIETIRFSISKEDITLQQSVEERSELLLTSPPPFRRERRNTGTHVDQFVVALAMSTMGGIENGHSNDITDHYYGTLV